MSEIEKPKRKFKFEVNKIYSKRKLRNIPLDIFQPLIAEIFRIHLTVQEYNTVVKANTLLAQHLCNDYKYEPNDVFVLTEKGRILTVKIPLYIRKNIEMYEIAHNIKTMWGHYDVKNIRGQNFKFNNYD